MENVKIKSVSVENLKAVSSFMAFFEGKSAHVTGANGIGKSTVIRTLTDRLRGLKPSIITKIGEKQGKTTMELTDGCRFEWQYNDSGRDELSYFTPDSFKPVRRDVFKGICSQYFPNQFDINKFLTTTEPAKRLHMISELVQVDLTEVQGRYKTAFDIRRDAKKELQILENQIKPKPESQSFDGLNCDAEQKEVDIIEENIKSKKEAIETERTSLNTQYAANKKAYDFAETEHKEAYNTEVDEWIKMEDEVEDSVNLFNNLQEDRKGKINYNKEQLHNLVYAYKDTFIENFIDMDGANEFIENMPKPEALKIYNKTPKPELEKILLPDPMPSSKNLDEMKNELSILETDYSNKNHNLDLKKSELSDLSASKQVYDMQVKQFNDYQADIKKQAENVRDCESDVAKIHAEIKTIIAATKLPDEFQIDLENKNDILFRVSKDAEYLPITNETLASSAIFIAAFKLQANYLEAFRVAHFDVSYLDYENREKVLKEAIAMNIQLITESPAMNKKSSMLQYYITEENGTVKNNNDQDFDNKLKEITED